MCAPYKRYATHICPAEGGGAHREEPGNTCGQKVTVTQTVSAYLGEVQKGGIPPSAPFGPGPFREKGLALAAEANPAARAGQNSFGIED